MIGAMMRFNERKATQAAAYLLKRRGGQMSYLKLIKSVLGGPRGLGALGAPDH